MEDVYTFNIASHYASAIVNGDYTGLNDAEEKQLNAFLDNLHSFVGEDNKPDFDFMLDDYEQDSYFDIDEVSGLYSDCIEFKLYIRTI
jgi:hypothetical protein